jgi:hypothetical protein
MAETWVGENNQIDYDNLPEVPDAADAGAQATDIVDGTKQKRNRLPSNTPDDNPDDGNLDDAPKPKRGRGRPHKDDDPQQVVAAMRKELEEIRNESARLSDKLKTCVSERDEISKDLELTRSSLMEREHDYADLLDQFSNHEENNTPQAACKPSGIVFFDEITESCVSNLKPSICWNKIRKGLGEICESDNIKNADIVLILSGSSEIASGVSAFHLHQTLKRILAENCDQTQVYVAYLPPNNNARVQVDLYNHKLNMMESDNVHILKVKFLGSKLDLVGYNGFTPNSKCIALYDEIFKSISVPTSLKSKETPPDGAWQDFEVTSVLNSKWSVESLGKTAS